MTRGYRTGVSHGSHQRECSDVDDHADLVAPLARTPTSAATSNCSHPATVMITGAARPVRSVGGPRQGTPRLRSASRHSLQVAESALEDSEHRGARGLGP